MIQQTKNETTTFPSVADLSLGSVLYIRMVSKLFIEWHSGTPNWCVYFSKKNHVSCTTHNIIFLVLHTILCDKFCVDIQNTLYIRSCRKRVVTCKMDRVKKAVNPRWKPRNGCDNSLMAKILITKILHQLVKLDEATWIHLNCCYKLISIEPALKPGHNCWPRWPGDPDFTQIAKTEVFIICYPSRDLLKG